ncbi:TyeA family type III secretion system gatekeeper subunit [Yersinia alsatica]|uniref:TyeA family type III secretion system gatekeeper subunit n=1 Tax=Yersinia alsatica TaxID=2890317 RepID=A0ABY5UQ23_9GAMM|nr:TyeA family type III secretion system gatekeeper subunit [Yersinia alsatica]OWF66959.1 SepL/TyeA/HrpJ family type III secretion system gatekeeper [Yersinia frederiksenii]UWM45586.1 TyeA family type III secretion system gatekeeper subunit [Yersinia alsatica]CNC54008.1 type III secretion system protein SsaL [Yersinia frederiksenii]CNL72692.1 type III secretion system protein SsaL [Yersinia frederiksenii]CNL96754.1 type III secretion system protein SsaL [Yersinia frederiksenii]
MINTNNISDVVAVHGDLLEGARQQGEITPAHSVMQLASLELEEVRQTALEETMEGIGLSLGSRLRDQKSIEAEKRNQRRQQLLVKLITQLSGGSDHLLQPNIPLDLDISLLASKLRQGDLSAGQQILLLAAMMAHTTGNPLRRRSLAQLMAPLLEDAGWEIELFGLLELGTQKSGELSAVKQLFTQSIYQDEFSIVEWFTRVSRWPERQQRVRVLMRAIAFELSCLPPPKHGERLSATLYQLRRLLMFLGLEDHCNRMGKACGVAGDTILSEVLAVIGQHWLFSGWLQPRIEAIVGSDVSARRNFIRRFYELFNLMPIDCFDDQEQQGQILATLLEI